MPARTNEFQELVARIKMAFSDRNAVIKESAMVEVEGLEGAREIDVLIEEPNGEFRFKVAVEAKDESRKMDLTKLESLIGKYTGPGCVPVEKVIVVTRQGYTENAKKKASMVGFELVTLTEILEFDWSAFQTNKFTFMPPMNIHAIELSPKLPVPVDQSFLTKATMVCACCGRKKGILAAYIQRCLQTVFAADPSLRQKIRDTAPMSNGVLAKLEWETPEKWIIQYDDCSYEIRSIAVSLCQQRHASELDFTELEWDSEIEGGKQVVRAKTTAGGKQFELLFPDGPDSKQIVLNIRTAEYD